ncbi:35086_t:CDS:2 [Gigaspora margarita]|uniref:35086_t:CDS:1 n=1 Tax=Gigaspora margarita TaxID=4874 RepID=A0ABN7V808_GIGMA|nr:35086_t:CDS:2 [Gigaspora margarita]
MGITEHFTRLRLQAGMCKARIINNNWSPIDLPNLKITNDKRKKEWILSEEGKAFKIREKKDKSIQVEHWRTVPEAPKIETRIEKCLGCEHNRSTVEENCIMHIKFDEGWKLNEKLKEEILAILIRNLNHQQRKYCYYTDGSLQKEDKEKGDIAVIGAAVVQTHRSVRLTSLWRMLYSEKIGFIAAKALLEIGDWKEWSPADLNNITKSQKIEKPNSSSTNHTQSHKF